MDPQIPEPKNLTTEELAVHFGVTTNQVRLWKRLAGFPADAFSIRPDNRRGYYDLQKITRWLRQRDYRTGRKPAWLAKIGHPLAASAEGVAGHG